MCSLCWLHIRMATYIAKCSPTYMQIMCSYINNVKHRMGFIREVNCCYAPGINKFLWEYILLSTLLVVFWAPWKYRWVVSMGIDAPGFFVQKVGVCMHTPKGINNSYKWSCIYVVTNLTNKCYSFPVHIYTAFAIGIMDRWLCGLINKTHW